MENTAKDELMMQTWDDFSELFEEQEATEADIVEFSLEGRDRDSLYENFTNELDAWARQALASNGFGDY